MDINLNGRLGSGVSLVFSHFNYFVIPKGVSEPRVFGSPFAPAFGVNGQISGRVALRDLVF
jgi:hypothetical protein